MREERKRKRFQSSSNNQRKNERINERKKKKIQASSNIQRKKEWMKEERKKKEKDFMRFRIF